MHTDNDNIRALVSLIGQTSLDQFKQRCRAVYIMGSLARGGFSEAASDIDIGIVLQGPLQPGDQAQIDKVLSTSVTQYPDVKNNVSIFWGSVESINGASGDGRYPPFDRLDLIDHALLVNGIDIREQLTRPSKQALETASAKFALAYLGNTERIEEFFACDQIAAKGTVYITKTILFPARFIYLQQSGEVAGNAASYQFYIDNFQGYDAELVALGYHWRTQPLPESISAITEPLSKGLVPLYQRFINSYIPCMKTYHEDNLAEALQQWKLAISQHSQTRTN